MARPAKTFHWINLLPVIILPLAVFTGPSSILTPVEFLGTWTGWWGTSTGVTSDFSLYQSILIDVRVPRVLLAFLTGGALAISGASLQAVFKNPLVDPFLLGIASGGAFGAALGLAFPWIPVTASAFLFAFLAVWTSVRLATRSGTLQPVALVLSGSIISGVFTAFLTLVQFLTDPFRLQTIVHWTMGNLHQSSWEQVRLIVLPVSAGVLGLILYRWRLNVLALGDDEAWSAGLSPEREKRIILIFSTLVTASVVSVAGIIGLFGLFIPHMIRMVSGPDNRKLIPASFTLGGTFLVIIDTASRSLFPFEVPIGIFTMILGAPVFLWLIRKGSTGWA